MTVWKYVLSPAELQDVGMPAGAKVLMVALQDHEITVWALVDPSAPIEVRPFAIVRTGHPAPAPDQGAYCGSVIDGPFVWHVFEAVA